MRVAVSGKGGAGKTTIAAGLATAFAMQGLVTFAVDADPDANLGYSLGFSAQELAGLVPLSALQEEMRERVGDGALFVANPDVTGILERYSLSRGRLRLMRMGALKRAGSECYCRESAFLSAVVRELLTPADAVDAGDAEGGADRVGRAGSHPGAVVMDMSAGVEHLTRGTARGVDVMLVVAEDNPASLRTGTTVARLARELGVSHVRAVANKVRGDACASRVRAHFADEGVEFLGGVPWDADLASGEADWSRRALAALPGDRAWAAIRSLADALQHIHILVGEPSVTQGTE